MSFRLASFLVYISFVCLLGCQPSEEQVPLTAQPSNEISGANNSIKQVAKHKGSAENPWSYIQIDNSKQMWGNWDEPEWLRYFGLDAGDINGDGLIDVLSGRYVYLQATNQFSSTVSQWQRLDLGDNVDGILVLDIDGDSTLDIIAQALPNLYWYELSETQSKTFSKTKIGEVPATTHVNSQGFTVADVFANGPNRDEFLIAGNGNIYVFASSVSNEGNVVWQRQLIAANTSDEGIGVGDIDGDGDLDIAAGRRPEGGPEPLQLNWYENPGHINSAWQDHNVGTSKHPIDRVAIADLNADGKGDIVFSEERYPGLEPDAELVVFLQSANSSWDKKVLATQFSMNNLDIGDIDQDGDLDLVTAEHKGQSLSTQIWQNDGQAGFSPLVIDTGKESHLGTQLVDIDKDGDLDLISAGWDQHQFVHLWLNPLVQSVRISDTQYLGREHFKIETASATFLLDKKGGGFSSLIDLQGNDWISFRTEPWGDYPDAAAGGFRGLPNAVHNQSDASGSGHPGFDKMTTKQVSANQLESTSVNGAWRWLYTFYPEAVKMEVLASPSEQAYWFLYEGTPGGLYDLVNTRYGTNSLGFQSDRPDFFKGSIKEGNYSWAYFSHSASLQSLFVAQVSSDNHPDVMSYLGNTKDGVDSPNGMVVFGFGRDKAGQPQLTNEHTFLIGLAPITVQSAEQHKEIENYLSHQISTHSKEAHYAL